VVDWDIHQRWDSKLNISSSVSDYIVHAIDSKGVSDKKIPMPEDFKKHTVERKLPRAGGSNFSIADIKADLHDRYRDKVIQEEDLKFLLATKSTEYVKAYYLHIFLDYLEHQRSWIQQTGESIEVSIDKCCRNKCVSLMETQVTLAQVKDFLKEHSEQIKNELSL
jgi:hypothetical protein